MIFHIQSSVANKSPTWNQLKNVDFEQVLAEEYDANTYHENSEEQVDIIANLQASEWHNNANIFSVGEEAEYIAEKDSEIGKSGLPFNITKEKLKKVTVPDVGKVPSQADDLIQILKGLTKEQCERIMKLDTLSPSQQDFLS
eukprot:7821136-Ditylum_brightwellii.AAC.1